MRQPTPKRHAHFVEHDVRLDPTRGIRLLLLPRQLAIDDAEDPCADVGELILQPVRRKARRHGTVKASQVLEFRK